MYQSKKVVSIIPARAGSKRIPGKNKFKFKGQTLVEWSIKFSLLCKYIDKTIISSDDKEIKKIVENYNVSLHNRNKELSSDTASSFDLIKDIYFNFIQEEADVIILLQPTSPLREKDLLFNYLNKINLVKDWSSAIEVFPVNLFTGEIKNGFWNSDFPEETRSQDIPSKFVPSGRFYAYNCKNTLDIDDANGNKVIPFLTEEWKNINIDVPEDLKKLEYIYSNNSNLYNYLCQK